MPEKKQDHRTDIEISRAEAPERPAAPAPDLSRRRFLAASGGAAALAALAPACRPGESADDRAQAPSGAALRGESVMAQRMKAMRSSHFPQPYCATCSQTGRSKKVGLNVDWLMLDYVMADFTAGQGAVRAYNQAFPGPTIMLDPGDQLRLTLTNNLIKKSYTYDFCGRPDVAEKGLPHCFNTTNIHYHGLHVSPLSICRDGTACSGSGPDGARPRLGGDDIFIEIPPRATATDPPESQDYCIQLPDFHAPGTHWYHAHKHGSTAIQVNNGLAGTLIIREQGDVRILGDQPHRDLVWLMQEVLTEGNDQLVYAKTAGTDDSAFLINGVFLPSLTMQTGEVQRWRFVNATSRPRGLAKLRLIKVSSDPSAAETLPAALDLGTNPSAAQQADAETYLAENAQTMHLFAVDGVSFYGKPPMAVDGWDFAPGNRADFLIKLDDPGLYVVYKDAHQYASGAQPSLQPLGWVVVNPGTGNVELPSVVPGTPPCYLDPIEQYQKTKEVDFLMTPSNAWNQNGCPGDPPWSCATDTTNDPACSLNPPLVPNIFVIDCKRFNPDPNAIDPKYKMLLGTAEQWQVNNLGGAAHPFHIHVNPFQILEIYDPNQSDPDKRLQTWTPETAIWWDTTALPFPKVTNNVVEAGYVKIRQRFTTYYGEFVIHCHFLNHEDMGMMKKVEVLNNGHGILPCSRATKCTRGS